METGESIERFLDGLNADFAALRGDPEAWEEELAERSIWDATLPDGLQDEEGNAETNSD